MKHVSASTLVVALVVASAGCGKKQDNAPAQPPPATEKLTLVAADIAPCLNGLRPTKEPTAILRKGDLVYVRSDSKGHLSWKQKVDGVEMSRDSDMVIVSRSPGNEQLHAFTKDLGDSIDVPTAAFFCGEIDRAGIRLTRLACSDALQRHRTSSGTTVGFVICNDGPCPIVSVENHKAHVIHVDAMIDVRPIIVDGRTILLATRRFNRNDGTWTGGAVVPIDMSSSVPKVGNEIQLDEVDARDSALVRTRSAQFEIKGNVVRVFGDRAETERTTGVDKSRVPFEETHVLGK